MKKKKKMQALVSSCLALAIVCGLAASPCGELNVRAETSSSISDKQDKIKDLQQRNEDIDYEIASIKDNISENERLQELYWEKYLNTKDTIDNFNNLLYYKEQEIEAKQADINALNIQIDAKEEEIEKKKIDITNLEAENEKNLDNFGEMLHALYITENTDIFSVLSNSSDIYDLLVRTKMMLNITEQNNQLMEELKLSLKQAEDMLAQLEQDKIDLQTFNEKLNNELTELETAKADLETQQAAEKALSEEYNNEYAYYSSVISDFESKQNSLTNEKAANKEEIEEYEKQIQREILLAQQKSNQVYQEGDWIWPLDHNYTMITTYFGWDDWRSGMHKAIDISGGGINGANIYASKGGTVITAKDNYIPGYSYGKYVVIDHGDGYSTLYAHCSALYVSVGTVVNQGDIIAAVGSTGWSTGPHLHFAVNLNGVPQDPFNYVKKP